MAEIEVTEALYTLRQQINQIDDSNPDLKARLEGMLDELEDKLEATEDTSRLHLVEDMQQALSEFEIEHPTMTGVLNQLLVTLGNMGI